MKFFAVFTLAALTFAKPEKTEWPEDVACGYLCAYGAYPPRPRIPYRHEYNGYILHGGYRYHYPTQYQYGKRSADAAPDSAPLMLNNINYGYGLPSYAGTYSSVYGYGGYRASGGYPYRSVYGYGKRSVDAEPALI